MVEFWCYLLVIKRLRGSRSLLRTGNNRAARHTRRVCGRRAGSGGREATTGSTPRQAWPCLHSGGGLRAQGVASWTRSGHGRDQAKGLGWVGVVAARRADTLTHTPRRCDHGDDGRMQVATVIEVRNADTLEGRGRVSM